MSGSVRVGFSTVLRRRRRKVSGVIPGGVLDGEMIIKKEIHKYPWSVYKIHIPSRASFQSLRIGILADQFNEKV